MKVELSATVDVCEQVHVTVEDIMGALHDYEGELDGRLEQVPVTDRGPQYSAKALVNAAHQCIKAVPDDLIAAMNPEHRNLIAGFLAEQAARYVTKQDPVVTLLTTDTGALVLEGEE